MLETQRKASQRAAQRGLQCEMREAGPCHPPVAAILASDMMNGRPVNNFDASDVGACEQEDAAE
eukprot:1886096-Rhodomonas_salina.1